MTTITGTGPNWPPSAAPRRSPANRLMLRLLAANLRHITGGRIVAVRYQARSGAQVALPVQAGFDGDRVVVLAANAARKQWWRHFRAAAPVEVLIDGRWCAGTGRVVTGADSAAASTYRRAFPGVRLPADATFVVMTLPGPAVAPPVVALRGGPLVRTWFWTVTIAEFLGFAVPALVGALSAGSIGAWPAALVIVAAAVLGPALLMSVGAAQWLVLRRRVARAGWWIASTAAAWLLGLGAFLGFAMPLWQPGQPVALIVLVGAGGGALMAATTSAITGSALRRLLT